MPSGGAHEAFLTTDYNAEMIEHVERHPGVRDRAIFVGNPEDIIPLSFGNDLPSMRDWVPKHFEFAGYIIGEHPQAFGTRAELRAASAIGPGSVCALLRSADRVSAPISSGAFCKATRWGNRCRSSAWSSWRARASTPLARTPPGVEVRAFVPDLDRHLAACDLAIVQGGLTTCMELTAAGTPFLYFPLKNHFEQNFHVPHRLDRYRAGRRMEFATSTPDTIAEAMVATLRAPEDFAPVEADGAVRAARMLADLI